MPPEARQPLAPTATGAARHTQVRVIWSHFARDVKKRRRRLLAGAACGLLYALARVVEPWPIKVVFDQVLYHKPASGWWVPLFTPFGTRPTDLLIAAGLLLAVAGLVRGLSYFYEDYLIATAAQQIVYAIRTRLYRHMHALPLAYHQKRRTGDTLVRLSSDIILMRDVAVDGLVNLGTGVAMLVLMSAVMLVVDPVLTLVAAVVMPLIMVFTAYYGRRIRVNSKRQRRREGEVAAAMHEALSSMAVVQVHGASGREQARFHDINRRSLKQGIRSTRLEAAMNRNVEITVAAGLTAVMVAGTLRVLHGALTPGELIVFVSYLRAAYRPLQRASKTVQRTAKALAAAERVVEVLDTTPALEDAPDAVEAPRFAGEIRFEEVSFSYVDGQPALSDVTIDVAPATTVAIVGETGSGKSTLLSLVPRLHDVGAGRVTIDGVDVRDVTLESLRAQISIVLQESVLFGLTIAENIRYGAPDATGAEVEAAARAAGIHEFVESLPDGYDTVLSERGASLSGGQRQRIAIARALVRRTPVLLLDEPTTGLDAATQRSVVDALENLMRDTTTIIVSHDIRLVQRAAHIVVLEGGRVAARGTHHELLRTCGAYRRLCASDRSPARSVRTSRGPRMMFYSHNGVGVGHMQRQLDLATAYKERHPESTILLATGSQAASMFAVPPGIDYIKLPSLQMVDRYRNWEPRALDLPTETVTEMRSEILERAVRDFAPDVLVVDFMPTGPYGELMPGLHELARAGGAAVAGFRDVVDEPAFVRELWAETGVYDALRRHYAEICVYGDPAMLDFVADYGLDPALASKTTYCGYLGRTPVEPLPPSGSPMILASSGGGVDGAALIEAFVGAAGDRRPSLGGRWIAVTGPLMPQADHRRIAAAGRLAGVEVQRISPDLRRMVAAADCVVSMAGYNTVCDILTYRRAAVLVPRGGPSLEQAIRTARLGEWRCTQTVSMPELTQGRLADAIAAALAHPPSVAPVPLGGVRRALEVFERVHAHARAA